MKILLLLLIVPMLGQPLHRIANPPNGGMHKKTQSDDETAKEIHCGQIQIRGSDQLTQPELCHLLDGVSQNLLDAESRNVVQERIIKEYHRRGFLEASLNWNDVDERADTSPHAVHLIINEGSVYHLRKLEMMGNENTPDRVIRRRVVLEEGFPFDEDLLELSIKRINQLGIFQEFTREDIEVIVNKKGHFVDLTFRLKEK